MKGLNKAYEIGYDEGWENGREEGREEIIKNMDAEQFDVNSIAKAVSESVEEVCRILGKPVNA